MKTFYTPLLALLPLTLANFTYDRRNLGDYQKIVFEPFAPLKAIEYEVIIPHVTYQYR